MTVKIVDAVTYSTFSIGQFGLGIVQLNDNRNPETDGDSIFVHRLSENGTRPFTPEEEAEIKADCDALVKLLKKFYHESEFVEE